MTGVLSGSQVDYSTQTRCEEVHGGTRSEQQISPWEETRRLVGAPERKRLQKVWVVLESHLRYNGMPSLLHVILEFDPYMFQQAAVIFNGDYTDGIATPMGSCLADSLDGLDWLRDWLTDWHHGRQGPWSDGLGGPRLLYGQDSCRGPGMAWRLLMLSAWTSRDMSVYDAVDKYAATQRPPGWLVAPELMV